MPKVTTIEIGEWIAVFVGNKLVYWHDYALSSVLESLEEEGVFAYERIYLPTDMQKKYIGQWCPEPNLIDIRDELVRRIYLDGPADY